VPEQSVASREFSRIVWAAAVKKSRAKFRAWVENRRQTYESLCGSVSSDPDRDECNGVVINEMAGVLAKMDEMGM
jgi:hypothetical protein